MTRIELWNGDICDLEVDAIVSPATTSLWMSTGTAGEIKRAGGDAIEFAAIRQGPAALGDAIVTPAGRLAARVVIHAVSLERDRRTSGPAIDRAARSTMARVRELGLSSVAFPALGTGIGGFPLDEAARIAVTAVREELEVSPQVEHVVFALRGGAAFQAFAHALAADEPAPSRPLLFSDPLRPAGSGPAGSGLPEAGLPAADLPATPAQSGERAGDGSRA